MTSKGMKSETELNLTRVFKAPRAKVYEAWSKPEHIRHWACPDAFTIPDVEIDFRTGGLTRVCMRAPDGSDHWSEGHYLEVVEGERVVSETTVGGDDPMFSAITTVTFEDHPEGTLVTVHQSYTLYKPGVETAMKGAPTGWGQTLDKLERLLAGMIG